MTEQDMKDILKRLGIEEGKRYQTKTGKMDFEHPKQEELVSLMKEMKSLFEQELAQERTKLAELNEQLVKAKKGGCNG